MINKKSTYIFFIPCLILILYAIIFNYQINFSVFQVSDYDYHWNSARTASSILNLKYNISNLEFPLIDYFKNYGHDSTFQVIPTLNPIYLLSFLTNVENVILIQKILENFFAMLGIYLFLLKFSKNTSLILCFSIIYLSFGYNLSPIVYLNKDFFYFPLYLYFLFNFIDKGKLSPLILYLILLNFVSNWVAILTYPTISFFIYLALNKNKFFSSAIFSILIFFSLPLIWVPVVIGGFSASGSEASGFGLYSLLNFFSSFVNDLNASFSYFIKGGGDSFLHPYSGTVGPLYIPIFFYFSILFLSIKKFKNVFLLNQIIIFVLFILVYFFYFFFFSEIFHPMKIRHHISMIPSFIIILNFILLIYFRKDLNNKYFILFVFFVDLIIFGLISSFENYNFFYEEQNKFKLFNFLNFKASYLFPFLNVLILIFFVKLSFIKKYVKIFLVSILMLLHVSTHSAWLNKFESRSNEVSKKFVNYYEFFKECTAYINKEEKNNILLNSHNRLNDNFILLSNLNKQLNFRIFPEYEETNSALVGYLHYLIVRDEIFEASNKANYFSFLDKNKLKTFSKASSLGYFEMKNLSEQKIEFLGRIGVNKIISDVKISGAEHLMENRCEDKNMNLFIYNIDLSSDFAFLSNYKLDAEVSNNLFYNNKNYKQIKIDKIKNLINFNLNEQDLKFNYLYLMVSKRPNHILKIDNILKEFSDKETLDSFLSFDLSQLENDKKKEILIKYSYKLIYFSIFLMFFSAILLFIFKKYK